MLSPEDFADMREAIGRIDERTSKLDQLATKESVNALGERVTKLEDERRFIRRTSVTAVITGLVALVKSHWGY